ADEGLHVFGKKPSDVADAKEIDLAELAGIDDEPFVAEAAIEIHEGEFWIGGIVKRGDDVALDFGREIGAESELAHSLEEGAMVSLVTRGTSGNAAFQFEFLQRLGESENGMGGGRIAKLAGFFHVFGLREEIKAEAARITVTGEKL